jgi:transposase
MKKIVSGIDVSKEKLDLCLVSNEKIMKEPVVENTVSTIKSSLKNLSKEYLIDLSDILICAEYTGQYTCPLICACDEPAVALWLENPTQIKHNTGVHRGKNDKTDARRIASYAIRFQDKARLFSLPEKSNASLKLLLSERDMYMTDKSKYQGQLTDQKRFMSKDDYQKKSKRLKILIKNLNDAISIIDKEIKYLIECDETLANRHRLLCSVDGVGERTAIKMIVVTNAFRDFINPRKFCCHAGVAPFSYTSGSSRYSKNRVSDPDKSIKVLLRMAALSVISWKRGELYDCYLRKVAEGKNKMTVINAIRAKLIYRMFAVIKHNKIYEKNYANAIA